MSLTGWGVDVVEDVAAAALGMSTAAVGWGLQHTLPQPLLANVAQLLPTEWSSKMGLKDNPRHRQQGANLTERLSQQPGQQPNGYTTTSQLGVAR